jgi:hypothetical protein
VFLKFYLSVFGEILKCSKILYFSSENHGEKDAGKIGCCQPKSPLHLAEEPAGASSLQPPLPRRVEYTLAQPAA